VKIAVIGSNGQLGSEICRFMGGRHQVTGLTHEDIEIANIEDVSAVLAALKPQVVINTAAYHHLSMCEKNPEKSFQVNALGVLNLSKVSNDLGAVLVHYSTDYVFDGKKKQPYVESDKTNPLNIYALTKLDGEILIKNYTRRYFILRISGIYGETVCRAKGNNFITTMQQAAKKKDVVKVVDDEILTPTSVSAIARNTEKILETEAFGLYHMTCEGACSWFEFAGIIFKELHLKTPLISCKSSEFPVTVKRPSYSVLENKKLRSVDLNIMPHWKEALIEFLHHRH
jgi:dTDP-4-dehydrorhamnose reductase